MMRTKDSPANRADAPKQEFSLISNDTLLALYRNLLKCRAHSSRATRGNGRKLQGAWAFDAAAVALATDLLAQDTVIAAMHNPALQVARGETVQPHRTDRSNGASHPEFSVSLQAAVGVALTHKTNKTGNVSVVFGGRGDRKAWLNTLEIARAHHLPMIFVVDPNALEKEAAGSSRKTGATELEPGTELPRIIADGNDAVAMYRVAHEAIERARRDRGPTLIECIAFRLAGRRQQDSITTLENYLRGKGLIRRGMKQEILEDIARASESGKRTRRAT